MYYLCVTHNLPIHGMIQQQQRKNATENFHEAAVKRLFQKVRIKQGELNIISCSCFKDKNPGLIIYR